MNGAGIRLPSQARKAIEAATTTATHVHSGTRRNLSAKLDLGEAPRELGRLGRPRLDPDVRRGLRDVAEDGVGDRLAAGRLLERRDVELGGAAEVVLAPGELAGGRAHPLPSARVAGEQL
jgi:hypothetical protein